MSTRVLLVDDEEGLLITLSANLELEGFEVAEATSGAQALELLAERTFDVVLTDIRMPGMSGVELFAEIRRMRPDLPVILTTAFTVEAVIRDALRDGAYAMLPKPANVSHVIATLTRAAQRPFVLLVDDPAGDGGATTVPALERVGLRIKRAASADEALAHVTKGDVDVCVMEVAVSSSDLIERIHRAVPGVTVVAVSAQGVPALMQRAASAGALAWLRKPFQPHELVELVADARGRASRAR